MYDNFISDKRVIDPKQSKTVGTIAGDSVNVHIVKTSIQQESAVICGSSDRDGEG